MKIEDIITEFRGLKLESNPVIKVYELFSQIGSIAYMEVTLHKGKSIIRARPNYNGERFFKKSDYSFKPQEFNTTYQRASTPNKTMFYGCILPENIEPDELNNARIIGALESMSWLRDKTSSGYRKISFGKWQVEEDINLIAIIHKDIYFERNNFTRELVKAYNTFISQYEGVLKDSSIKFQKFLAEEFSKEVNNHLDYLISAVFTEIVTTNKIRKIDGILYPSVRTSGDGFNIAITPEACSKLSLYAAGECSVYKLKDNTVLGNDYIVQLDGKTDEFELAELENHQVECLQQLGVNSISDLQE